MAHVASAISAAPGTGSVSCDVPAGTADGHVMVAAVMVNNGGATSVNTPSGWTPVTSVYGGTGSISGAAFFRRIASSEPASYTFSWADGAKDGLACITTESGIDTTGDPVDAANSQYNSPSSTSYVAPGVTTTVPNARLIGFFCGNNTSGGVAPAGGMTERQDVDARPSIELADETWASPSATGTRTATATTSRINIGALIALKPATAAANDDLFQMANH